jgi:hypothetical protein
MYYMLVACMAGPLDTGQRIATHLLFHIIPLMIYHLVYLVLPEDPTLLRTLAKTSAWRLRGHPPGACPKRIKCFKKPKKKIVSKIQDTTTTKQNLQMYLMPAFFATLKVGCHVERKLRCFLRPFQRAPRFLAHQGTFHDDPAVQFNSDSFLIGIDNHASRCMANAPPPKCAGCLFGTMTKIPWRGKETKASHEVFIATKPGECDSVDQMTSTEVEIFAQLKGTLTMRRYRCATIFVDHFSRLRFVNLQSDDSSEETIEAKRACETFAAEHGMQIQHYHCDNGRFYDNAFKQACHDVRQQHLLWRQCPFPKRHCRALHPRPLGERM